MFIRIYYIMLRFHLILYLREIMEIEFRINVAKQDYNNIKRILKDIFEEIYNLNKFDFSDIIIEEEEILLSE